MTDCAAASRTLSVLSVENEPWQKRARRAGLTQAELARLAGKRENAISEGLRGKGKGGVPTYLRTIIRLWEVANRQEREAILGNPETGADD
jgi:transcriptional regulator with XRE-family HTH domain